MQEKDSATNTFLRDNERFAEIFNVGLFEGKKVLNPKKLKEVDRTSGVMLTDNKDKIGAVTKYRDVVKESEIGISRIITAVENQSDIHYAMPIRVLLLDALDYESQRVAVRKKHKEVFDIVKALTNDNRLDTIKEKTGDGGANMIADMLEEDIKVVESIYKIIKAHPEYTTDEIYKVYEAKLETA